MTSERAATPPPPPPVVGDDAVTSAPPPAAGPAPAPQPGAFAASAGTPPPSPAPAPASPHWPLWLAGALACAAVTSSFLLWQRLQVVQEQLARQTADAMAQAVEARTMAKQSHEQVVDATSRLSVAEARLSELAAQRVQIDTLMQSVARSRDENLLVDIDSMLRSAQQHAQFTGSLEPLVAALRSADLRLERTGQARVAGVRRAIEHDLRRLTGAQVTDTSGLLMQLDELVRQIDELPLKNAVGSASIPTEVPRRPKPQASTETGAEADSETAESPVPWWRSQLQQWAQTIHSEVRALVRVSRIDQPDAILLEPAQAFFLRENLKLKLLNARLGVLSRQFAHARADLNAAQVALEKYFDPRSRRTQLAVGMLHQAQTHLRSGELPRLDETLTALASLAAQP